MKGLFTLIFRSIRLRSRASKVPTCITPLGKISSVTVLLDPDAPDTLEVEKAVRDYFKTKGKTLDIFTPSRQNLNWPGRLSKKALGSCKAGDEDLFISLVPSVSYAVRYAAITSRAVFKIGRRQLRRKTFDIIVSDVEGATQARVFEYVAQILEMVK